jgi:hypothetical protein
MGIPRLTVRACCRLLRSIRPAGSTPDVQRPLFSLRGGQGALSSCPGSVLGVLDADLVGDLPPHVRDRDVRGLDRPPLDVVVRPLNLRDQVTD